MKLAYGYELGKHWPTDVSLEPGDRLRSQYIIGSSGSGKSSLMENMIVQDVEERVRHAVFDVEERLTTKVLQHHADADQDVILVDPTLGITPFNVLSVPEGVHPHSVIEGVLQAFRRAWWDSWGPRMEDYLRHVLILFQELGLTIGELLVFISNQAFRERVVEASNDLRVRLYFKEHLSGIRKSEYRVWAEALRNKIGALVSNPFIAPMLSTTTCLDFLPVMDVGQDVCINLPERLLGDSGKLLGMLAVSRMFQAALRRQKSDPYIIYADEFQNFASRSFTDLSTRGRKRGVGLVVAHQSVHQSPFDQNPDFLSSILANTMTQCVFQVGREDAERFAKEIFPATGTEAKRRAKHWLWGDHGPPTFYSVNEEREHQYRELETQAVRECFIKIKGQGTYCAEVYETPQPRTSPEKALQRALLSTTFETAEAVTLAQNDRICRFSPTRRARQKQQQ